jgi:hypothetical protein
MADYPLARKVLDAIDEHQEQWWQKVWAVRTECRTTYCVAGWTVLLAGYEMVWERDDADGVDRAAFCRRPDHAERRSIEDVAAKLLDLDDDQKDELFWATGTDLGEFRRIVDRWEADEIRAG